MLLDRIIRAIDANGRENTINVHLMKLKVMTDIKIKIYVSGLLFYTSTYSVKPDNDGKDRLLLDAALAHND